MVLLHGSPDDWRTWNKLLPSLHEAGYRTIVPSLRGFGETRFKNEHAFRSGEMTAIAEDTIELADALDLDRFALVGHGLHAQPTSSRANTGSVSPIALRSRSAMPRSIQTRRSASSRSSAIGTNGTWRCRRASGSCARNGPSLQSTPGVPGHHRGTSPKRNSG
jgi:pimeloyl-ACP methyl ester carboxylesterase